MTEEEIVRIEELASAATPGNWPNYNDPAIREQLWRHYDELKDRRDRSPIRIPYGDAEFIAASREAVPKLIAALRAERQYVKVLTNPSDGACMEIHNLRKYRDQLRDQLTEAEEALKFYAHFEHCDRCDEEIHARAKAYFTRHTQGET